MVRDYLFARKRLLAALLAVSTLVGLCAAYVNGGAGASKLQIATATTHVLVDLPTHHWSNARSHRATSKRRPDARRCSAA